MCSRLSGGRERGAAARASVLSAPAAAGAASSEIRTRRLGPDGWAGMSPVKIFRCALWGPDDEGLGKAHRCRLDLANYPLGRKDLVHRVGHAQKEGVKRTSNLPTPRCAAVQTSGPDHPGGTRQAAKATGARRRTVTRTGHVDGSLRRRGGAMTGRRLFLPATAIATMGHRVRPIRITATVTGMDRPMSTSAATPRPVSMVSATARPTTSAGTMAFLTTVAGRSSTAMAMPIGAAKTGLDAIARACREGQIAEEGSSRMPATFRGTGAPDGRSRRTGQHPITSGKGLGRRTGCAGQAGTEPWHHRTSRRPRPRVVPCATPQTQR